MKDNWATAFARVLDSEGGYSNDPADHGGETNLGVTKSSWEAYLGRPVAPGEMHALTVQMVEPYYKRCYWDACKCDALPTGLDYAVFDFAVNAGVNRSIRYLQRAIGVLADGLIGPATLAAVAKADPKATLEKFSDDKSAFYTGLVMRDPSQKRFIKGWLARVEAVHAVAQGMMT